MFKKAWTSVYAFWSTSLSFYSEPIRWLDFHQIHYTRWRRHQTKFNYSDFAFSECLTGVNHNIKTVIRPMTEYACAVWHSSITAEQRGHWRRYRRAVRIIFESELDFDILAIIRDISLAYLHADVTGHVSSTMPHLSVICHPFGRTC